MFNIIGNNNLKNILKISKNKYSTRKLEKYTKNKKTEHKLIKSKQFFFKKNIFSFSNKIRNLKKQF